MNQPAADKERLRMEAVHVAELELEKARQGLREAQRAYSLAKRRHTKAQQEYFACKHDDLSTGNHERDMGGHGQ
jgi:hypothetical protein